VVVHAIALREYSTFDVEHLEAVVECGGHFLVGEHNLRTRIFKCKPSVQQGRGGGAGGRGGVGEEERG
jgi:hypothetical protein